MIAWMQTASGLAFDLLSPSPDAVRNDDVIHHLARIGRFSGATRTPRVYSVLQHSHLVARILEKWGAPPAVCYEGAYHEGDEPYIGDITRPVQVAVRAIWREMIASVGAKWLHSPDVLAALAELSTIDPLAELRARVGAAARAGLGLPPSETAIVKRADNVALAIEKRDLMSPRDDWNLAEYAPVDISVGDVMTATQAEEIFRGLVGDLEMKMSKP